MEFARTVGQVGVTDSSGAVVMNANIAPSDGYQQQQQQQPPISFQQQVFGSNHHRAAGLNLMDASLVESHFVNDDDDHQPNPQATNHTQVSIAVTDSLNLSASGFTGSNLSEGSSLMLSEEQKSGQNRNEGTPLHDKFNRINLQTNPNTLTKIEEQEEMMNKMTPGYVAEAK